MKSPKNFDNKISVEEKEKITQEILDFEKEF
jgi:hypothetical protein